MRHHRLFVRWSHGVGWDAKMGSGSPGALLWGLSLGDNLSTVLLLICSCCSFARVQSKHPGCLGGAERLLDAQHPGLERGQPEQGWESSPGTSQWAPNWRDAQEARTAAQGQLQAAAIPCSGENPDLGGCRDKVQTLFPLNQKYLDKPA